MKDKTKVRTKMITTYVTEQEYCEIVKAAKEMNMSFSSFVRKSALVLSKKDLKD